MPTSTRPSSTLPRVSCEFCTLSPSSATLTTSFNHGQTCCAGSRIYVQKGIYDKFAEAFKAQTSRLKVGDPFEPSSYQGPQVSQLQADRIMGYVKSGQEEGATIIAGGKRIGDKGFFIEPVSVHC